MDTVSMSEKDKSWIDQADYETLLRKWRFGKSPEPLFMWETGSYFVKTMYEKKIKLSFSEQVRINKSVGWK